MAVFRAGGLIPALAKGKPIPISKIIFGTRAASDLPKHMLPGPYPKTPEERAAAAKKYNMILEDYEPYPDDGWGNGDYPMLPNRSQHERDPYYEWDNTQMRRNWGEPMHYQFDMYTLDRVDTSPTPLDWRTMVRWLCGFLGLSAIMFYFGSTYPCYPPVGPKQYPYNNLYLEKGGDPAVQPEPVKHYEL